MKKALCSAMLLAATAVATASTPFINHGRPASFLDVGLQAAVGGVGVTQNFTRCFPEISELDMSMSTAWGLGAVAEMSFSDFLGLGVQANFLVNNYRLSMAVADDDARTMTSVFERNRFCTFNFPVYASFRFNLGQTVRWTVDGGLYYSYGLSGTSKTAFYNASVNELGQMTTTVISAKADYYNSPEAFLASSKRGDFGLHVGTGFVFSRRLRIGIAAQIGLKNAARTYNSTRHPNIHNACFLCTAGWTL